ncbi:TPA: DUF1983 domain-containing protein [Serratia marcescens]|uniref:TipJ family phage tail tip protein n=1 Tax=Serratia bockelmannii TaxID=2703793 RepID=UPI00383697AE
MAQTLIRGRKGGGGAAHTPVESPDDLQSNAKIKILLALSEGEIAGELDGTRILLDGTPVHNADGSENFTGLKWEVRNGTQMQDYIQGMPDVESETSVNVKLTTTNAWTRTFTNTDIDALRIRMGFPSLFRYENNGDMHGAVVEYKIELSTDGAAYQMVVDGKVEGKTTSLYERDHRVNLPKATNGWTLRVSRLTPDSTSSKLVNNTQVQTYTEIVDAKFRYPNTALLFIEFDAAQFNAVPKITVRPKGKIIRIPANYDPLARSYSGAWDGSFKWAWSNNPAWVFYDIALDKNYGLGNRVSALEMDKWGLYRIAQYCDELVSDGLGGEGKEPRFLCDVYIQSQQDAYTVLRDISAIFRGITYWGNDQLFAYADMPRDMDFVYSRANVINGEFTYASGSYKNRYTSALVKWGDPSNHYAEAVEAAYDNDLVKRYGVNQTEITAIGCTRRTEAHRRGRWAILSNAKDRTVSFNVGLDGNIPLPARIIGVADAMLAGKANGGRIRSAQERTVVLDREVEFSAGDRLCINLPDGTAQRRTIASIAADKKTVTLTAAFRQQPEAEAVWSIDSDDLAVQQFRVISVQSNDDGTFTISAVEHDPNKYAFIDNGVRLDSPPLTVTPPGTIAAPANITISRYDYVSQGINIATLRVQWAVVTGALKYEAQWRKDSGNWVNIGATSSLGFEVNGIFAGNYDVRVRAVNAVDVSSPWGRSETTYLAGKEGAPPRIVGLRASTDRVFGIQLSWMFGAGAEDGLKTTLAVAARADFSDEKLLADVPYPQNHYDMQGLRAGQTLYFRAAFTDKNGLQSEWTEFVRGISSDKADIVLEQIANSITETELGKELLDKISSLPSDQNVQDLANKIAKAQRDIEQNKEALAGDVGALEQALESVKEQVAGTNTDLNMTVEGLQRNLEQISKAAIENSLTLDVARTDLTMAKQTLAGDIQDARHELSGTRAALQRADAELQAKVDALTGGDGTSIAEVISQVSVLREQDQALAEQLAAVVAKSAGNAAQIAQEKQARSDADEAMSQIINSVKAVSDKQQGTIAQLEQTQADAQAALAKVESDVAASAQIVDNHQAEQGRVNAAVTAKTEALANQQQAIGEQLSGLGAEFSDNQAQVTQHLKTLTDSESALARQLSALESQAGSNTAAIAAESQTRAEADSAQAKALNTLGTTVDGQASAINVLQQAASNAESSMAGITQSLEALSKADIENALNLDNSKKDQHEVNATITVQQQVQADQLASQARQLTRLQANFGDVSAELQQELTVRATEDSALSRRLDSLNSQVGDSRATLAQLQQVVSDAESARAGMTQSLEALSKADIENALNLDNSKKEQVGVNAGLISKQEVHADKLESQARQLLMLQANFGDVSAGLRQELTVRATEDSALSQRLDSLNSQVGESQAAITQLQQTQSDADSANASLSQSLAATAKANIELALKQSGDVQQQNTITAGLQTQQTVLADQQQAQARQLIGLQANFGSVAAKLATELTVRAQADSALAQQLTTLSGTVDENQANVEQQLQVLVDTGSAQAKQLTDISSKTEGNRAVLTQLAKTVTDNQSASSQQIVQLNTEVGKVKTNLLNESSVRSSADSALGQRIDHVTATAGNNTAAVQEVKQAQASLNGKISASWSLKVQADNAGRQFVAGMALGVDGAGNSQFLVQADRFALLNNPNGSVSSPFAVQNGQTFINAAFIANASIDSAKIAQEITSSNYAWHDDPAYRQGWAINKNGYATFSNMDVRGRIFATSGVFNNVTINENCDVRGKVYANRIDGDIASMQAFSAQTLRKHDGVYTYVYAGGMNYAVRLVIPNIKVVYYSSPRGSVCNMRIKLNGNILRQHRFSRVSGGDVYEDAISIDIPAYAGEQQIRIETDAMDDRDSTIVSSFVMMVFPLKNNRFWSWRG